MVNNRSFLEQVYPLSQAAISTCFGLCGTVTLNGAHLFVQSRARFRSLGCKVERFYKYNLKYWCKVTNALPTLHRQPSLYKCFRCCLRVRKDMMSFGDV